MEMSDEECVVDFNLRQRTRLQYPGACSLAFQDVMSIVIKALIRWDEKKGKGGRGIFGVPIAYGRADEEQGRKTLHAHMQIWIEFFNELRDMLFHPDEETRIAAKAELTRYIDQVMMASYGDEVEIAHRCECQPADAATTTLQSRPAQVFRDCRHEDHCCSAAGKVMECSDCLKAWTTGDVVNTVLSRWKSWGTESEKGMEGPITGERLDIAAVRHPYDYLSGRLEERGGVEGCLGGGSFWTDASVRHCLLHKRFDEHCCYHRPQCFKKGSECRAVLPKFHNPATTIILDDSNRVSWEQVVGTTRSVCAFEVLPTRRQGDQFLNVFNRTLSNVVGSNTNIQIGDYAHVYYSTLYTSKSTQKEDTASFINVSNALGRHIARVIQENGPDTEPDFIRGLSMVLSGIRAHLSSNIVSATMGHLLVTQGGRFTFSHDFSHLLLTQLADVVDGKEVSFRLRKSRQSGKLWADSFANDVIWRPAELENMCSYEMQMHYEKTLSKAVSKVGDTPLSFIGDHPGKKHAYLRRLERSKIPMISMGIGMPDMADLERDVTSPSTTALALREQYAKKALLLFLPFRSAADLISHDGTHWTKFQEARNDGSLWPKGLEILQNIQNRTNSRLLKRPPDQVALVTTCKESTGERKRKRPDEKQYDYDVSEVEGLFQQQREVQGGPAAYSNHHNRTHKILRRRANVKDEDLLLAPLIGESVYRTDDPVLDEAGSKKRKEHSSSYPDYGTVLEFIEASMNHSIAGVETASLSTDAVLPADTGQSPQPPTLSATAREYGLDRDMKQLATYEIVCCTFLLDVLRESGNKNITNLASSALDNTILSQRDELIGRLRHIAAKSASITQNSDQLLMYLTGAAGGGKSHCLYAAQKFCKEFSASLALPFDEKTFYFTSCTGSSAALWEGTTVHTAAHLNKRRLTDDDCKAWINVRILVIDEVSYFSVQDLITLDKKLRRLRNRPAEMYGGLSIIYAGDFHQTPTMSGSALYSGHSEHWQGSINCTISLEGTHRFEKDPEWGRMLKRFRKNQDTREDRQRVNTRFVDHDKVILPVDSDCSSDICYACPTNVERNSIAAGIFENHISNTHPAVGCNDEIPAHTIIIEASVRRKGTKCSRGLHEAVYQQCGDADVKTGNQKKIEPALRFYNGVLLMVNSNKHLKRKLGNGSQCKGISLKLKPDATVQWKNWDGRRVNTVNIDDVEYIVCQRWPKKNETDAPKYFKLVPETDSVIISLNVIGNNSHKIGGVTMTQFGVNNNIATTGHKLQGLSKDALVVASWGYRFENWVYVVLSRVRTLDGLYLLHRLDEEREFKVDENLFKEEERLEKLEDEVVKKWREASTSNLQDSTLTI